MIKIDCEECYGNGTYDVGPECYQPASSCCGGCYKTYQCEDCDGNGYVWIDEDEEE
jgi:hypothetical protein